MERWHNLIVTYQFELGFARGRHAKRLDAFLSGVAVEESEERLVWSDTLAFILLNNREAQLQRVSVRQLDRVIGLQSQREPDRSEFSSWMTRVNGAGYGSLRVVEPSEDMTVILGPERLSLAALARAAQASSERTGGIIALAGDV